MPEVVDMPELAAPFPYFGGKSPVAAEVWRRFGRVRNYIEPFCGSAAMLLCRPEPWDGSETINDIDAHVANFWRATQAEPDAVAELLNWPVNETDLEARHKWLVTAERKREHGQRMRDEPDYYDVRIAAWWCWGLCAWIGRGWCTGVWHGRGAAANSGVGVNLADESRGGKRPHLGYAGRGVHRQRPHLGGAGQGVHRQLPHLGHAGRGECARRLTVLPEWMQALRDRLRNVRVCCGDWRRVCSSETTLFGAGEPTAVFLDPPYSAEAARDEAIYASEDLAVAHDARAWCLEHGDDRRIRIALCGYEGEHEALEAAGWDVWEWTAQGGYAKQHEGPGLENRHRERIWFSPHCRRERLLFDG